MYMNKIYPKQIRLSMKYIPVISWIIVGDLPVELIFKINDDNWLRWWSKTIAERAALTIKDHPCEEKQVLDDRLWSKTMCVHISKLIYKKINFEYKTTIRIHLSENRSFEDSFSAIDNSNACGLFSK